MLKTIYYLIQPILNPKAILLSFKNLFLYPLFLKNYIVYKQLSKNETVAFIDLYPCLNDKGSSSQSGKGHYFYQDIWALKKVFDSKVSKHIDIGSRIDGFAGQCSALCEVEFIDFRPVDLGLKNFSMKEGNILSLPYPSNSIHSLSCLHVVEHIGLGRYGDPVDPMGSIKSIYELQRVIEPGGVLYFGIPIGTERVAFNAHRIFDPQTIVTLFSEMELLEFSVIDDAGKFTENTSFDSYRDASYACGLFWFRKII